MKKNAMHDQIDIAAYKTYSSIQMTVSILNVLNFAQYDIQKSYFQGYL